MKFMLYEHCELNNSKKELKELKKEKRFIKDKIIEQKYFISNQHISSTYLIKLKEDLIDINYKILLCKNLIDNLKIKMDK